MTNVAAACKLWIVAMIETDSNYSLSIKDVLIRVYDAVYGKK